MVSQGSLLLISISHWRGPVNKVMSLARWRVACRPDLRRAPNESKVVGERPYTLLRRWGGRGSLRNAGAMMVRRPLCNRSAAGRELRVREPVRPCPLPSNGHDGGFAALHNIRLGLTSGYLLEGVSETGQGGLRQPGGHGDLSGEALFQGLPLM